jgi:hypothetical protein
LNATMIALATMEIRYHMSIDTKPVVKTETNVSRIQKQVRAKGIAQLFFLDFSFIRVSAVFIMIKIYIFEKEAKVKR